MKNKPLFTKFKWGFILILLLSSSLAIFNSCNKEDDITLQNPVAKEKVNSLRVSSTSYHFITNENAQSQIQAFNVSNGGIPVGGKIGRIERDQIKNFKNVVNRGQQTINFYPTLKFGEVGIYNIKTQSYFNRFVSTPEILPADQMVYVRKFQKAYGSPNIAFCFDKNEIMDFIDQTINNSWSLGLDNGKITMVLSGTDIEHNIVYKENSWPVASY